METMTRVIKGLPMSDLPIEKLLPRSNYSVYGLARMAAKRALELSEGKPALIKGVKTDKLTTIALEEILQGKIETKAAAKRRIQDEADADKDKA
jgi:DNA-directed RNA polymerase omega subunit